VQQIALVLHPIFGFCTATIKKL